MLLNFMAQEGSEASVASSSATPNIWWEMHTNYPISSWNIAMNHRWQPQSNSSCEDQDMSNISTNSFTNASNLSGLSMDSSSADMSGEPSENHLWSQVLLNVGDGGGGVQNDGGENFLEMLSSKNLGTDIFNPACDYLKKLDSSWGFTNHQTPITNNFYNGTMIEHQQLHNLSNLVNNWSIATPNIPNPNLPPYAHHDHIGANLSSSLLLRPHAISLNNSMIGLNNKYCNGISDSISFNSFLNKPAMEFQASKLSRDLKTCSSTKGSGRGSGTTSDGKKKRSEESSEAHVLIKKSKHESSSASSVKLQPPKVKLGDKINALQQIVSPFGKTDTASVLLEAIKYIGYLQEQIQLLSDPYMKSSANKDHNSWGGSERKEIVGEPKLELRSRGLCVVPISCTPQVYRENTGPDYWPAYRGCLYK